MSNDIKAFLNKLNEVNNKVFTAQKVFTNKICELLGITMQELVECVHNTGNYRLTLFLPSENIYLIASTQNLVGWNTFFHITKENVCIHNIGELYAFDLHRSQGTSSYSFTADQVLINKIYKSIERKDFKIVESQAIASDTKEEPYGREKLIEHAENVLRRALPNSRYND